MTFFALRDYKNKSDDHSTYLALRVETGSGVEVVPDMDINITKLNNSKGFRQSHFLNNGYGGITFKIKVLIKSTDTWNNQTVVKQLHNWYINMTPLHVVTEAIDVDDGEYIISKNPTRNQSKKTYTEWELEFTSYTPLALYKYKNDNTAVLNALQKAKEARNASKNKATVYSKLAKCDYRRLTYSKNRKKPATTKCVKYLQKVLYKKKLLDKKYITGKFDKNTQSAIKQFQKKYNKTNVKTKTIKGAGSGVIQVTAGKLITNTNDPNISLPDGVKLNNVSGTGGSTVVKVSGIHKVLPVNGKIDKATFKALCES